MNSSFSNRFRRVTVSAVAFLGMVIPSITAARAQETVINNGSGGVTVHDRNGTTTRITNGGVVTTARRHGHKAQTYPPVRRVRVINGGTVVSSGNRGVSVSGNNRTLSINAKNRAVSISGNNNKVTVTGTCLRLTVSGNNNRVTADHVASLEATGNDNRILWRSGANGNRVPGITQTGSRNVVSRR